MPRTSPRPAPATIGLDRRSTTVTGDEVGRPDGWWRGLRVLRLCSVFPPGVSLPEAVAARFDTVGGMQTHTSELTRALDELGVVQTVVTTRPPGTPGRSRLHDHVTVMRVGLPVPTCRQFYAVPAAPLLHRLAAGADLLHAHLGEDLAVVPLALSAARRSDIPVVFTVHTSVGSTLQVSDARSLLMRSVGGWWERRGERSADGVITLTDRLADILVSHGVPRSRVAVVPSGIRSALFDAPHQPELPATLPRPRILFLGRLHPQKNVDLVLHAMTGLQHPTAHLVLVGDGPHHDRLVTLRDTLGLRDRVTFVGFVDHDRVPGVLADADVLVMPSRYEELGTVLVEAMASGLPVVATRTGGIPQVVQDGVTGVLVEPADAAGLASALDRLLGDPVLRRRMADAGRLRADNYRWERLCRRVLDVYGAALGARAGGPA